MSYTISNTNSDHLGFIVMTGGPDSGECLIRAMPADSQLIASKECEFLSSLQEKGELFWQLVDKVFVISDPDGDPILSECEGIMKGAGLVFVVEKIV